MRPESAIILHMSAQFTPEERKLLFPIQKRREWDQSAFLLTRLLKHNRRLIIPQELHIVTDLADLWRVEAEKLYGPIDLGIMVNHIEDYQWKLARWPLGANPVQAAVESAHRYPDIPERPYFARTGELTYTVLRVAYNMVTEAIRCGEPSFYLSSHHLANLLNVRQKDVHRALTRLVKAGFLQLDSSGDAKKRTANTYAAHIGQPQK